MLQLLDLLACKGLQVLSSILRSLPLQTALAFGRFLGRVIFCFSNRRKVAYADLKAAFPGKYSEKERWKIVRENFEHFGQMFVEVLRFPSLTPPVIEKTVTVNYLGGFFDVFKENKGGIFLTAHFGNWEMMQVLPPGIFGVPMQVLARSQKFPKLNAFLNSLRESLGTVVTTRGMEIRNLLHSLRRKEWVGLLGDQDAGRDGGLILPFLGRKTTVPTGPFEFASRTQTSVIPVLTARRDKEFHDIFVGKPIICRPDSEEDILAGAKAYIAMLEDFITKYPSQWLWETKRWKYSWTKRILILSDGKPGHVKQSLSLAEQLKTISTQHGRSGMEYPSSILEVKFKSAFHRRLFPWFAFFWIPFAQGRLSALRFFFEAQTARKLEEASADFIISAGSGLVPLNLGLAKDSRAKSLVLMRPGFPFNFWRFDLAVVPAHDTGVIPEESFRTLLTPSSMEPDALKRDADKLAVNLRDRSKIQYSIFLGGDTRRFKMGLKDIQIFMQGLERAAGDFLITTSRRTSAEVENYLKQEIAPKKSCQMLVIANEDKRPEVAGGMMALAPVLIVTEDSISMISEALRTGKKVLVLCFDSKTLPTKHRRFREILARESAIVTAKPENFYEQLRKLESLVPNDRIKAESAALTERLQKIL